MRPKVILERATEADYTDQKRVMDLRGYLVVAVATDGTPPESHSVGKVLDGTFDYRTRINPDTKENYISCKRLNRSLRVTGETDRKDFEEQAKLAGWEIQGDHFPMWVYRRVEFTAESK